MKIENIKFKAKRLDDNSWVFGYFYEENGNTYIIENRQKESKLNRNLTYQVDPETVCQFTGLTDCEGNEIWEGDIVEREIWNKLYNGLTKVKGVIEYKDAYFLLRLIVRLIRYTLRILKLLATNSIRRNSV